jgi:hypothetical protein
MIIRIYKLDNTPAAQGLDSLQHFGREFLGVISDKVSLDFCRTSPCEFAERAPASRHVYVLHMSFALLDPSEVHFANCTNRPRLETNGAISLVLRVCGALNSEMPSGLVGLCLAYDVSMHSNHDKKLGGACLVGWKIGL